MGNRGRRWFVAAATLLTAPVVTGVDPATAAPPTVDAAATVETEPVASAGDAADDPAIWRDPVDPARSVVIGNDKGGALEVYDLSGARIQRIAEGFFGNVDVRGDLVVTYRVGVRAYRIDPSTRQLANVTDTATGSIGTPFSGEGLCLYRSPLSGQLHVFVDDRSGNVAQYALGDSDADGLVEGTLVRQWDVGGEVEGCVADDVLGRFYVSEEDVGIWRYDAEPSAPTGPNDRVLVDATTDAGGHLSADVEGLAIVQQPGDTGYLLASGQGPIGGPNDFVVYDRIGANGFIRSFRVVDGPTTDGCSHTDGIDALAADLGPAFPHGMFVCQDDANTAPGSSGTQNFKLVPLERVVELAGVPPPPPPPPSTPITFVGQAASNANLMSHAVTVPPAVAAGDALVLFFSSNTTATITDPPGWQVLDTVVRPSTVTRVWSRVATAADAGSVVRVGVSSLSKGSLVVAAYRGTSPAAPIAAFGRTGEPASTSTHSTPVVSVTTPGAVVLSYWSHKDSTTTALTPPPGVTVRAAGTQTGSGRVTTLLADGGAAPAGPNGGLQATAASPTTNATMWTIALAPADESPPPPPPPSPPPPSPISFVGQAAANGNLLAHRVTVPAAVESGDGLLLFFSVNTTAAITNPAGWQPLTTVTRGSTGDACLAAGGDDRGRRIRRPRRRLLDLEGGADRGRVLGARRRAIRWPRSPAPGSRPRRPPTRRHRSR